MGKVQKNESLSLGASIRLFLWIILIHILLGIPFQFLAGAVDRMGLTAAAPHLWVVRELAVNAFVLWRLSVKRGFHYTAGDKPAKGLYLPALLLVLGTRLVFDNSLAPLLSRVEPPGWLYEAFGEMLEFPLLGVFTIALIAPIFEEIIFRGIFLKQLLKRYSPFIAITFSALLFGIMHLNLHQAVNGFVLGIVLGIIFHKTGSVLLCMAAHMANNLFAFFVGLGIIPYSDAMGAVSVLQLMIGVCGLLLGSRLLRKTIIDPGGASV